MWSVVKGCLCPGALPVLGCRVVASGCRWPGQPRFHSPFAAGHGRSCPAGRRRGWTPHDLRGFSREQRPRFGLETRMTASPPDREVHRHVGGFYPDGTGLPAPDRRREGFPDRPARPMTMPSRAPPRPHISMPRFGFEDVQGRDCGSPLSQNRAAERRYPANPRPAGWPQVHAQTDGAKLPRYDIAEDFRPPACNRRRWVESVLCVWRDWTPTDELHQAFAGMRPGPTPCQ